MRRVYVSSVQLLYCTENCTFNCALTVSKTMNMLNENTDILISKPSFDITLQYPHLSCCADLSEPLYVHALVLVSKQPLNQPVIFDPYSCSLSLQL